MSPSLRRVGSCSFRWMSSSVLTFSSMYAPTIVCWAAPWKRTIWASISALNIGVAPDSSSRMICSRIERVMSAPDLASTTSKSTFFSTSCLTSASVM